MPEVEDRQSSEELYQKISSKIDNKKEKTPFHQQPWFIPTTSVAAILLLVVTAFSFLFNQSFDSANLGESSKMSDESADMQQNSEATMEDKSKQSEGYGNKDGPSTFNKDSNKTGIREDTAESADEQKREAEIHSIGGERLNGMKVFYDMDEKPFASLALPTQSGDALVPVTIIAPPEWGSLDKLYNTISYSIKEKEWGVKGYQFENVQFTFNKSEDEVIADFPGNYAFPSDPKEEELMLEALEYMFRPHGVTTIRLSQEGEVGIPLKNAGSISSINMIGEDSFSYSLYQFGEKISFLIPVTTSNSVEEAINEMTSKSELRNTKPLLNENFQIQSISTPKDIVIVEFRSSSAIPNNPSSIIALEAILLTAKSYGYQMVEFKHKNISQIGNYPFNKPIEVPDAINPQPFSYPPGTEPGIEPQ